MSEAGRTARGDEGRAETVPQATFRLVVQYDGRAFEGWQVQAGDRPARTVQGALAAAAGALAAGPVRVRGAGRTDSGVHAWGQLASLQLATGLEPGRLLAALNARLPEDVAVLRCDAAPADYDALRAARAKLYRYQVWNGRERSPLRAGRWYWFREALDLTRMRRAAGAFVGHHDFAAMQAAGSSVKTTDRTLTRLEIAGTSGGEVVIEVEGEGFLRHMVRNLAGTLLEIGRGRWEPARAREILASRDRGQAGPTAPAHALALVQVWDDFDPAVD